jgi:D-lyxose ketol-isomerase
MESPRPLKRSLINRMIETAVRVFDEQGLRLPAFAFWSPEEWRAKGHEADEIRACRLGWDITDFGSGDFARFGRTLFTLRNGRYDDRRYPKPFSEKFLLDPEGQRAPQHFHRKKYEDIVNRGKVGNLMVQVCPAGEDGKPVEKPATVTVDGLAVSVAPWATIRLEPGMSVSMPPRTIHTFWGEEGTGIRVGGVGYSSSGEVASISDDVNDNVFLSEFLVRFPGIEEDEPPVRYLCQEYPPAAGSAR